MTASSSLPDVLREFIDSSRWTFAKSYADTWPHEYIVRDRVDESLFVLLANHIRSHGYVGKFYKRDMTYFDHDGLMYWTMGAPIEETRVINRCPKDSSYEVRLRNGTLPGHKSTSAAQKSGHKENG